MSARMERSGRPTVFVVVEATYPDDHSVLGVFNSKEAADRYINGEWKAIAPGKERPEIEEFEVFD